jgi:hypothetical protein
MSQRFCVCGKSIFLRRQLCGECLEIYGDDPDDWPEWLCWSLSDIQKDIDWERRHDEYWLDDEAELQAEFAEVLRGCRTETHLYQD